MDSNAQHALVEFLSGFDIAIPDTLAKGFAQELGSIRCALPRHVIEKSALDKCVTAQWQQVQNDTAQLEVSWNAQWLSLALPIKVVNDLKDHIFLLNLLAPSPLSNQVVLDKHQQVWLVSQLPLAEVRTHILNQHIDWLIERAAASQNNG